MYQSLSINLLDLLLSLSDALDLASPELAQHQLRTAFIAWEVGKAAHFPADAIEQLFIAALLHDVGALSLEDKINIRRGEVPYPEGHCLLGEHLLSKLPFFALAAKIVRFHHTGWQVWGSGTADPAATYSQALLLADLLERSLDRGRYILHQQQALVARVNTASGISIRPDIAEAFSTVAVREDFWLDLVSPRLYGFLSRSGPGRGVEIDLLHLKVISELFRDLIDFRSRFTATHSSGVAASAAALARFLGLTEVETALMEVAGNLHDLGKLVIPTAVLNKPDKLTPAEVATMRQHTYFTYAVLSPISGIQQIAEWAAFHHERLDGSGYPFHLSAKDLNIGARIMAVADIFTALVEDRPYRPGLKQGEVLSILKRMCADHFIDGTVVGVLEGHYGNIASLTRERQAQALTYYERVLTPE